MRRAAPALALDVASVLLFAGIGRASHAEGLTVGGVLGVAWPFLAALAVGWAVVRARGTWPLAVGAAAPVWLVTACLGLVLRVATGGGFAWSFGVVTLVVLGLFLVGWRCAREVGRFAVEGLARWSGEEPQRLSVGGSAGDAPAARRAAAPPAGTRTPPRSPKH
ncbi:DUF3054 domain-containing protein [Phycicoccus sp. Soil748]|uniref:DUF3054 domain-containing protein n=1 Tax=Phycicoccus sp. Soil748 TaxID=1736397 RepID=UPI0009E92AA6|nr:DUF3054 domain-containing protein [Phycicoccus sp. Soil748]